MIIFFKANVLKKMHCANVFSNCFPLLKEVRFQKNFLIDAQSTYYFFSIEKSIQAGALIHDLFPKLLLNMQYER